MRNIRLLLEYDGSDFAGWQFQTNARTVQGVTEQALHRLLGEPVRLYASGRTDTGVHAVGQVANFTTTSQLPKDRLVRGLNAHLPPDVAVLDAQDVPLDFDARHAALERVYRYAILNRPSRSALLRRFTLHRYGQMNLEAMRTAAQHLVGTHDFSAFRSVHCDAENPVRTLRRLTIEPCGPLVLIDAAAEAFLRQMVRIIVGTLLEVSTGRWTPDDVSAILASRDRARAGRTAPAHALCLLCVRYEGDDIGTPQFPPLPVPGLCDYDLLFPTRRQNGNSPAPADSGADRSL